MWKDLFQSRNLNYLWRNRWIKGVREIHMERRRKRGELTLVDIQWCLVVGSPSWKGAMNWKFRPWVVKAGPPHPAMPAVPCTVLWGCCSQVQRVMGLLGRCSGLWWTSGCAMRGRTITCHRYKSLFLEKQEGNEGHLKSELLNKQK